MGGGGREGEGKENRHLSRHLWPTSTITTPYLPCTTLDEDRTARIDRIFSRVLSSVYPASTPFFIVFRQTQAFSPPLLLYRMRVWQESNEGKRGSIHKRLFRAQSHQARASEVTVEVVQKVHVCVSNEPKRPPTSRTSLVPHPPGIHIAT